jgi:hypothetical protein
VPLMDDTCVCYALRVGASKAVSFAITHLSPHHAMHSKHMHPTHLRHVFTCTPAQKLTQAAQQPQPSDSTVTTPVPMQALAAAAAPQGNPDDPAKLTVAAKRTAAEAEAATVVLEAAAAGPTGHPREGPGPGAAVARTSGLMERAGQARQVGASQGTGWAISLVQARCSGPCLYLWPPGPTTKAHKLLADRAPPPSSSAQHVRVLLRPA